MGTRIIEFVQTEQSLEGQRVVAYPYLSLQFDVELPIGRKNKRVVRCCATCDLIKQRTNRADSIPETVSVEVDEACVLPAVIDQESAIEHAKKSTLNWVIRRFRPMIAPNLILTHCKEIYHPFLLQQTEGEMVLYNVVSRDVERWKIDEFDSTEDTAETKEGQ